MLPPAIFSQHVVVNIDIPDANGNKQTILFDPSYGTSATGKTDSARLLNWQNNSLDFVGLSYVTGTATTFELRMQAILPGGTYVTAFSGL